MFGGPSTVLGFTSDVFIKFNVDHRGYYVTMYDDWSQLNATADHFKSLSVLDRAGIVLDAYYSCRLENRFCAQLLPLLTINLKAERSVQPWQMALKFIDYVNGYFRTRTDLRQLFADLMLSWVKDLYRKQMWSEIESIPELRFNLAIIDLACRFGHAPCLRDALEQFNVWKASGHVAANFRDLAQSYGLKAADDVQDFEFAWERYQTATESPIIPWKTSLRTALSYANTEALVDKYLDKTWNEVPTNLFSTFLKNLLTNSAFDNTVNSAWNKFQSGFAELKKK